MTSWDVLFMLRVLLLQDPTTASRALDRWPELLLAAAVALPLTWGLLKLFTLHNNYRNENEKRRDSDMSRIIVAHEHLGSELVKAIRDSSDRSDANFKEITARMRRRFPEDK